MASFPGLMRTTKLWPNIRPLSLLRIVSLFGKSWIPNCFCSHLIMRLILTTGKCTDDASIAVWRLVNDGAEHDCNIDLKDDFEKSVNISDVTNLAAVAEYMRRLEKRDVQRCYLQGFEMNRGPDGWPNTCNYDGKCRRKCRGETFFTFCKGH